MSNPTAQSEGGDEARRGEGREGGGGRTVCISKASAVNDLAGFVASLPSVSTNGRTSQTKSSPCSQSL
jgi:hypothetical protein